MIFSANIFAQSTYVLKSQKPLVVNVPYTINEQTTDTVYLIIDTWCIVNFQNYVFNYRYVSSDFTKTYLNKTLSMSFNQVDSLYNVIKSLLPPISSLNSYLQLVGYAGSEVKAVETFTNTNYSDWQLVTH